MPFPLPLDIVATHILPNLSTHSILLLLASGRSLHAGIRIALTHNNFSLPSNSPSLSHVVAQLGALRRLLRTPPTNHTTVVLLSHHPSLGQTPPAPATYLTSRHRFLGDETLLNSSSTVASSSNSRFQRRYQRCDQRPYHSEHAQQKPEQHQHQHQ